MNEYSIVRDQVKSLCMNAITECKADLKCGDLMVIFDIDGTLLTTKNVSKYFKEKSDVFKWQYKAIFDPIPEIVELHNWCTSNGIKTYLITGRKEALKNATILNLTRAGVKGYEAIYFRPSVSGSRISSGTYKMNVRKDLSKKGRIIANIGDQESDLEGGYAQNIFLLPSLY